MMEDLQSQVEPHNGKQEKVNKLLLNVLNKELELIFTANKLPWRPMSSTLL